MQKLQRVKVTHSSYYKQILHVTLSRPLGLGHTSVQRYVTRNAILHSPYLGALYQPSPFSHALRHVVLDEVFVQRRIKLNQLAQVVKHFARVMQVESTVATLGVIKQGEIPLRHFSLRGTRDTYRG